MGGPRNLTDIAIHQYPVTPFQQRVYALLVQIPEGSVTTYANLAKALTSSPRAVGNALRNNPFAPEVPCHRCIASSGYINGFNGEVVKQKTFKRAKNGAVSGSITKSKPKGAKIKWEKDQVKSLLLAASMAKEEKATETTTGLPGVSSVSDKISLLHKEGVHFDNRGMLKEKGQIWDGPWVL